MRGEFLYHFHSHFIAATADSRADGGDHVSRASAENHLHAANGFRGDSAQRSAPAGMNCGDDTIFGVGEKDRNAIGGLSGKKQAGRAGNGCITLQNFGGRGIEDVNDVGMNLFQCDELKIFHAESGEEPGAIFEHVFVRVPIREAEIQNFF